MEPLLICEAGLHGDGSPKYYLDMIATLREQWTGWPPIAFKMQHSTDALSTWAQLIRKSTGRKPLLSVNYPGSLEQIAEACRDTGIIFMSTPHDTGAVELLAPYVNWFKLGAFDATRPEILDRICELTNIPVVMNVSRLATPVIRQLPNAVRRTITGVSAYPANEPWAGVLGQGYSCHSVPGLIEKHVLDAAKHCSTIEVHVTTRLRHTRPLPGDMCVSLSFHNFMSLVTKVGEVWKQSPLALLNAGSPCTIGD